MKVWGWNTLSHFSYGQLLCKMQGREKPEVFRVHCCNLNLWAISLAQICPLLEGEGLMRARQHHSVKCLYLQIRQGKAQTLLGGSLQCLLLARPCPRPPATSEGYRMLSTLGQPGMWRQGVWGHPLLVGEESAALWSYPVLPTLTYLTQCRVWLGFWYEGMPDFQEISDPYSVAIQVRWCMNRKSKALTSSTEVHLGKLQSTLQSQWALDIQAL